jgi:hypothetical protein
MSLAQAGRHRWSASDITYWCQVSARAGAPSGLPELHLERPSVVVDDNGETVNERRVRGRARHLSCSCRSVEDPPGARQPGRSATRQGHRSRPIEA